MGVGVSGEEAVTNEPSTLVLYFMSRVTVL